MSFILSPIQLVLLATVFTSAAIAVRVLVDLTSARHRRRYGKVVKYNFIFGLVIGLLLPWNEGVGLTTAAITGISLMFFTIFYYLLGGRVGIPRFLQAAWTPREAVRDLFLYFSVTTGVIGIVSTVISIAVPPFLSLSLGSLTPLAFDGLSVLSALLEFTIFIPPYSTIYALAYDFIVGKNRPSSFEDLYLEDIDFPRVTERAFYNEFEVRDAMESLVRQGFATKQSPIPLGKVRFRVHPSGAKFLEACWNETYVKMSNDKDRIETHLLYLQERTRNLENLPEKVRERAVQELQSIKKRVIGMSEEYGNMLEYSWEDTIIARLNESENGLRPAKPAVETAKPIPDEKETERLSSGT